MLGIMDWGIGGLGVYRSLRRRGVTRDVVYFSDAGAPPYGTLSGPRVRERLGVVAAFLAEQGVREVMVACNAASAALGGEDTEFDGVLLRTIVPAVTACASGWSGTLGVIGGALTIGSGLYQGALGKQGLRPRFVSAQPLSALVEAGSLEGPVVEAAVSEVLRQLGDVGALVLACTHYPALTPVFARLAPKLVLLDPAEHFHPLTPGEGAGQLRFHTSGSREAAIRSARLAFGVELPAAQDA